MIDLLNNDKEYYKDIIQKNFRVIRDYTSSANKVLVSAGYPAFAFPSWAMWFARFFSFFPPFFSSLVEKLHIVNCYERLSHFLEFAFPWPNTTWYYWL